jgi:hypothetical protein
VHRVSLNAYCVFCTDIVHSDDELAPSTTTTNQRPVWTRPVDKDRREDQACSWVRHLPRGHWDGLRRPEQTAKCVSGLVFGRSGRLHRVWCRPRELSVVKRRPASGRSGGAPLTRMGQRLFDPVVGLTEAIPSSLVKAMEDGIWSAWSTNAL